ncbi:MAG: NUDIX hydrolase [Bacteroidetes bacterium]|nr:NUDIX hydrolase [Bacteroidota bacterium]
MNQALSPWKKLSSEIKYENLWIRLIEDQVINPAGNPGIYGVVHYKMCAIAVIPLDKNNNIWIVGQYRYPLQSYEWEIVEGGCHDGEMPLETAKRELAEEAGISAGRFEMILEMQLSNSCTDELSYTYIARDLVPVEANPEEDEQFEIKKLPFEEVYQMVLRGEIRDALSIASILRAKILLDEGKI